METCAIITDMEPKMPEHGANHLPTPIEYTPSLPNPEQPSNETLENSPSTSQERVGEIAGGVVSTAPQPVQLPSPVTNDPAVAGQTTGVSDDNPAVAGDEDLIEKEWVDKAKKIIAETKDDPYKREKEVGKLQADYLQKRYGKTLGSSE